jgi:hypothetical protein
MSDTQNIEQEVVTNEVATQPALAEFVGYENNLVNLKLHPGIVINAFLFLISASPSPENAAKYTDVLNIFSDLARLSQQVIDAPKVEEVAEVETPAELEVSDKPLIKAEPVEEVTA